MTRRNSTASLGDGRVRHVVRYEDDHECVEGTPESWIRQVWMLRIVTDGPAPAQCGDGPYQRLTQYHDGARWVLELEAVRRVP